MCAISCCLQAQVADTTVCDILKSPQSFNGKIVRVKATVAATFDQFVVKGAGCGLSNNNIWLSYPEGIKAKAGPAMMVRVQPARNFAGQLPAVERTPVQLDKSDKEFKKFDSLLSAPFTKGGMCLGCNRYEVTATLVGRLDGVEDAAIRRDNADKITGFGGFGNMNVYSARLVLQSVSDVSAQEIDYSKTLAVTKSDSFNEAGTIDSLAAARQAVKVYNPAHPSGQQLARAVNAFGTPGENYGVVNTSGSADKRQTGRANNAANSPDQQFVQTANASGKPDENSRVLIIYGNSNETSATDDLKGTKDSPDGLLYICTFNSHRLTGDAQTRALVFAGENVANLLSPIPGAAGASLFQLEARAWITTILDVAANKQKTLTLPGGYLIWNSSWPPADDNQKVEAAIAGFLTSEELLSK